MHHYFFSLFCGSGGSKSRLSKAADAEISGEMKNKKLYAVVAQNIFQNQNI